MFAWIEIMFFGGKKKEKKAEKKKKKNMEKIKNEEKSQAKE
jgi:hypothetical protein